MRCVPVHYKECYTMLFRDSICFVIIPVTFDAVQSVFYTFHEVVMCHTVLLIVLQGTFNDEEVFGPELHVESRADSTLSPLTTTVKRSSDFTKI